MMAEKKVRDDHLIEKNGLLYAGDHYLVDLYGVKFETLNSLNAIASRLTRAAEAGMATILETKLHAFAPCGVTGMLLLAESHISIHTWPNQGFAAVDVFMCGKANAYEAAKYIVFSFCPRKHILQEYQRGELLNEFDATPAST